MPEKAYKGAPISEPDVFKKGKKPYVLTFYDWLALFGGAQRVYVGNTAINSTTTIYTVPKGKILYLFSLQLNGAPHTPGGNCDGIAYAKIENNSLMALQLRGVNAMSNEIMNLNPPIQLHSGQTISVRSSCPNMQAQLYLFGLVVDRIIVEQIYKQA